MKHVSPKEQLTSKTFALWLSSKRKIYNDNSDLNNRQLLKSLLSFSKSEFALLDNYKRSYLITQSQIDSLSSRRPAAVLWPKIHNSPRNSAENDAKSSVTSLSQAAIFPLDSSWRRNRSASRSSFDNHYDPEVGRFVSKDPSGFGGMTPSFPGVGVQNEPLQTNLYSYAINDPINLLDSTGLAPKPPSNAAPPGVATQKIPAASHYCVW